MTVEVHLYTQAQPMIIHNVRNTYQKGDLYCVMLLDGPQVGQANGVYKFPLQHIFRVKEY
jgi:hypothetical protein